DLPRPWCAHEPHGGRILPRLADASAPTRGFRMNEAHRPSPLAARELGLRIPGGRWLLRGLTWQAARGGGILGVVGPNGAGKTTLLRSLVGLAKPPLGGVDLGGVAIERTTARQRARQLAYLPQGHSTPYDLPVEEVVMLGRAPHRRWFAA